jgi:hypothetical protein
MFFVPVSLRRWFTAHFIIDLLLGIPAILFPGVMLQIFGFPPTEQFTTRLLGAGLLGMGGAIFLMRNKGIISYRTMLNIKIIWSLAAIIAITVSLYLGESRRVLVFLAIFIVLVSTWLYYRWQME